VTQVLSLFPELAPAAGSTSRRFLGRCRADGCGRAIAVEAGTSHDVTYRDCPNGHGPIALRRVTGTYSARHNCDPRCMFAVGPQCECSCAGANHGCGYSI